MMWGAAIKPKGWKYRRLNNDCAEQRSWGREFTNGKMKKSTSHSSNRLSFASTPPLVLTVAPGTFKIFCRRNQSTGHHKVTIVTIIQRFGGGGLHPVQTTTVVFSVGGRWSILIPRETAVVPPARMIETATQTPRTGWKSKEGERNTGRVRALENPKTPRWRIFLPSSLSLSLYKRHSILV